MYNLGTYGCETPDKRERAMILGQQASAAKQATRAREGDLGAQVRELQRQRAALSGQPAQPARRGPGRPPKQ